MMKTNHSYTFIVICVKQTVFTVRVGNMCSINICNVQVNNLILK